MSHCDTPLQRAKKTELFPVTDTKYSQKKIFNHFHNPHFQVHHQDLSYSLYVQPLK